jgi:hypothetical protein
VDCSQSNIERTECRLKACTTVQSGTFAASLPRPPSGSLDAGFVQNFNQSRIRYSQSDQAIQIIGQFGFICIRTVNNIGRLVSVHQNFAAYWTSTLFTPSTIPRVLRSSCLNSLYSKPSQPVDTASMVWLVVRTFSRLSCCQSAEINDLPLRSRLCRISSR